MIPPFYTSRSLAQLAIHLSTIPSVEGARALTPIQPAVALATHFLHLDGAAEVSREYALLWIAVHEKITTPRPRVAALGMAVQRFANSFDQIVPANLPVATSVTDWETFDLPPTSRIFSETARHLQQFAQEGQDPCAVMGTFGRLVGVSEKRKDAQSPILRRYYDLISGALRKKNNFVARYLAQGAASWLIDVAQTIAESPSLQTEVPNFIVPTRIDLGAVPVLSKGRKEIDIDIATLAGFIQSLAVALRSIRNLEERTTFYRSELSIIAPDFACLKTSRDLSAQRVGTLFTQMMEQSPDQACEEKTIHRLGRLASKLITLAAEDIRKQLLQSPELALQIWAYYEPTWKEALHFTRQQILIAGGADALLKKKTRKELASLYLLLTHGIPGTQLFDFLNEPETRPVTKRMFLEIIVDLYNLGVPNFVSCFLALEQIQKRYHSNRKSLGIHRAAQYAEFREARALAAHPANRQVSLSHWMPISWRELSQTLQSRIEELKVGPGNIRVSNYAESQAVDVDIMVRSNSEPPRFVEIKNSIGPVYGKMISDTTRLELQAISLGLAVRKYGAEGIELVIIAESIHGAVLDLYERIWGMMKIPYVIVVGKQGKQTSLRNSGLQPLPRARLQSYNTYRPLPALPFNPQEVAQFQGER